MPEALKNRRHEFYGFHARDLKSVEFVAFLCGLSQTGDPLGL